MAEFDTNYLAHHGIKGQKWGDRNGPPYPLTQKLKSHAEKAAEKIKTVNDKTKKSSHESVKKYVRKHPDKIRTYYKRLSKEDIEELAKNIEFDKKIDAIADYGEKKKLARVKNAADKIGTVSNLLQNSKNLYNNAMDIKKIFEPKDDVSALDMLVRTGSKQDILDNIGKLTPQQLENAKKRLEFEDKYRYKMKED